MTDRVRYRTDVEDSARWDGFEFRSGDIVISAPSKTGTTWTQMICALLVFGTPDLPVALTSLSPWVDMRVRPVEELYAQLSAQRHRRFVKTHTPLDGVPLDDRATYLALCRDPRDVAVSLMHQGENLRRDVVMSLVQRTDAAEHGPAERFVPTGGQEPVADRRPSAPSAPMRDRLRRWIDSEVSPLENLDTLRGFLWQMTAAWERRHEDNVVLVHYGDLTADLEGEMRRLADRLAIEVPEQAWPDLVEAATFERMRVRSAALVPDEGLGIMKSTDRFFRSAGSGEWRTLLTEHDLARYHDRVSELAAPDLAAWIHSGRLG